LADAQVASPKFLAVAESVRSLPGCGHIVFVENVAAHVWLRRTLVLHGVGEDRIAILNAEATKDAAVRQQIAEEFNGTEFEPPKYDVVIANSIAYEGMDLQRRTCAIHHLDLPWEPATIQQRNGRGVRQGNTSEVILIRYYLAKGSFDSVRFQMIHKKRSWLTSLLDSQDRVTNNPGAQADLSGTEIAALLAPNEQAAQELLSEAKAEADAYRRRAVAGAAEDALRGANSRFRRAGYAGTPEDERRRLLAEADDLMGKLSQADPDVWPWASRAQRVREADVFLSRKKLPWSAPPLFAGDVFTMGGESWRVETTQGTSAVLRRHRSATVHAVSLEGGIFPPAAPMSEAAFEAGWDWEPDVTALAEAIRDGRSSPRLWRNLGDATLERLWPAIEAGVRERGRRGNLPVEAPVPVESPRGLVLADRFGGADWLDGVVMAPTRAGWARFVDLAVRDALLHEEWTWTRLNEVSTSWWNLRFPQRRLPTKEGAA
jgi:hypothetical protein